MKRALLSDLQHEEEHALTSNCWGDQSFPEEMGSDNLVSFMTTIRAG